MLAILPFPDDRKTGYQFGHYVQQGNLYHPGTDFNSGSHGSADLGLPVKAMAKGKVIFSQFYGGVGWGRLLVIEHPELKRWTRYAHFSSISVGVGEEVEVGQVIGYCGKSGTSSPHVHAEVIKKGIPHWAFYPNGWSKAKMMEYWQDPYEFVREINAMVTPNNWALESIEKAKKLGITNWDNPKELVNNDTLNHTFAKLKLINAVHPNGLSKEAFIHALDKAGHLDPK